ncbi:heat shock protein, partial [Trifolium pratense]
VHSSNRWQWCPDPNTGYTVRGAYLLLTSPALVTMDAAEILIWHSQVHSSNRWQWCPDPNTGYTVRGAYLLLTSPALVTMDAAEILIWHSQVPLKVFIFAWRYIA